MLMEHGYQVESHERISVGVMAGILSQSSGDKMSVYTLHRYYSKHSTASDFSSRTVATLKGQEDAVLAKIIMKFKLTTLSR